MTFLRFCLATEDRLGLGFTGSGALARNLSLKLSRRRRAENESSRDTRQPHPFEETDSIQIIFIHRSTANKPARQVVSQ